MTRSFSTIVLFTKTKVCKWPMGSVSAIVYCHASPFSCLELIWLILFLAVVYNDKPVEVPVERHVGRQVPS